MSFSAPNKKAGQKIKRLYVVPLPRCVSKNAFGITYLYISIPSTYLLLK